MVEEMVKPNLKKYRKMAKMTQVELAEDVEVTSDFISNIETGRNKPSHKTMSAIARVIAGKLQVPVSVDDIFFSNQSN